MNEKIVIQKNQVLQDLNQLIKEKKTGAGMQIQRSCTLEKFNNYTVCPWYDCYFDCVKSSILYGFGS